MQTPRATRPQRPARWLAAAWETGSIGNCSTLLRWRVAADPRQPGVDHVADAGHGQRRLGHVGREHDAPALVRLEDAALLLRRQPREQRQDLGRPARACRVVLAQRLGRLADVALAGQEDQHVAADRRDAASSTASTMASWTSRSRSSASSCHRRGSAPRPDTAGRRPRSRAHRRNAGRSARRRCVAEVMITFRSRPLAAAAACR